MKFGVTESQHMQMETTIESLRRTVYEMEQRLSDSAANCTALEKKLNEAIGLGANAEAKSNRVAAELSAVKQEVRIITNLVIKKTLNYAIIMVLTNINAIHRRLRRRPNWRTL